MVCNFIFDCVTVKTENSHTRFVLLGFSHSMLSDNEIQDVGSKAFIVGNYTDAKM